MTNVCRNWKVVSFEHYHPDIAKWWRENDSDFAQSLYRQVAKTGALTQKQLAAAQKASASYTK